MTRYVLPDLAYDYGALEPHISARIMELHHSKHHKAYVDGANKTLEQLAEARQKGALDGAGVLERTLAFHISGHVMHSIFWQNLSPQGRRYAQAASWPRPSTGTSAALIPSNCS